jgi:hypothetical protein
VIAIAACRQSASENKLSIDQYILGKLFPDSKESPEFDHFKSSIKKIRSAAKKSDKEVPPPEVVGQLKAKWERCRNPGSYFGIKFQVHVRSFRNHILL